MDFKKKARLSFEPLEARDVPAHLGLVVALPYPAAPVEEVALTAPQDLDQGGEANFSLNFPKIEVERLTIDSGPSADLKLDPSQGGETSASSDSVNALKVQMQDFHFTQTVNKASPKLFLSSDAGDALKVQYQDIHFTQTVNKASPKLFLSSDAESGLEVRSQDIQYMKIKFTDILVSS